MDSSLRQWITRIEERRRARAEFNDILAEYFSGDYNEDIEFARSAGLTEDEFSRLRREFEA